MAFWTKKSEDAATPPVANDPGAASMTPEGREKAVAQSKKILAAFGEITSVLMRSPNHKHHSIADLEWLVVPAVTTGQFSVAGGHAKSNGLLVPMAVVFWASVSEDVDKRLSASLKDPIKLQPNEWKSGDILWLVDAVGDPKFTRALVKKLAEREWGGKSVRFKGRDKDGAVKIGSFGASGEILAD